MIRFTLLIALLMFSFATLSGLWGYQNHKLQKELASVKAELAMVKSNCESTDKQAISDRNQNDYLRQQIEELLKKQSKNSR